MLICMWTLPCLTPQQEAFMKRHPPSTIIQSGYSPHIDPIALAYLFFFGGGEVQIEEPFSCRKRVTNTRRTTRGTPRQATKRLRAYYPIPLLAFFFYSRKRLFLMIPFFFWVLLVPTAVLYWNLKLWRTCSYLIPIFSTIIKTTPKAHVVYTSHW
jgi:hypothetical protein